MSLKGPCSTTAPSPQTDGLKEWYASTPLHIEEVVLGVFNYCLTFVAVIIHVESSTPRQNIQSVKKLLLPHRFTENGSRWNIAQLWKLFSYITIRNLKISYRNCASSSLCTHFRTFLFTGPFDLTKAQNLQSRSKIVGNPYILLCYHQNTRQLGGIQNFFFKYWSFLLVKLSLLILFVSFLVSVLCFFFDGYLSKVIALLTIAIVLSRS